MMSPRFLAWVFDERAEPFPATRFSDPEPGIIHRAVSRVLNMSERTAAVLCVLIAIVGALAIRSLG